MEKAKSFTNTMKVSVPYRGATFLNKRYKMGKKGIKRFRPLSGSYISQSVGTYHQDQVADVSVPYRGATFLNNITYQTL